MRLGTRYSGSIGRLRDGNSPLARYLRFKDACFAGADVASVTRHLGCVGHASLQKEDGKEEFGGLAGEVGMHERFLAVRTAERALRDSPGDQSLLNPAVDALLRWRRGLQAMGGDFPPLPDLED